MVCDLCKQLFNLGDELPDAKYIISSREAPGDAPVVRDPVTREPYVPGSSLKGKMRPLLERLSHIYPAHLLKGYFVLP